MLNPTRQGIKGEDIAVRHLLQQGYRILARNWRYRHLELDILAEKAHTLVVVEVKLRASNAFGAPEAFVTKTKQKNLIMAAEKFISEHEMDCETRFDVIAIIQNAHEVRVEHITDAFRPGL